MKSCKDCGTNSPDARFIPNSARCLDCRRIFNREYERRTKRNITRKEYKQNWQKENGDKRSVYSHRYYMKNRERYAGHRHNRRVLDAAAGEFDWVGWKELCDTLGNKCLACGKKEVTVDHIVPVSKGGSNKLSNLQPLCFSCNASKGAKVMNYREDQMERMLNGEVADPADPSVFQRPGSV